MGNFKKKFGKRILAYILSGAMILSSMTGSNMTAFASEAPKDTGEAYYEEAADSNTTASEAVEDEKEEASKNDENASGESEAAKTTETAKVETTETETAKSETTEAESKETQTTKEETTETETAKDEQTSETESSSVAETETETESDSETSEAVETESKEADEDLKAEGEHVFDATQLKVETEDKKVLVPDNEENFDKYFSVDGNVTKRTKSDMSINCVEVGSKASSSINFTVAEGKTATVTLVMSSTGGSNISAVGLADASGTVLTTDVTESDTVKVTSDNIITVKGTGKTTISYTGLAAGTYKVISPNNPNPDTSTDTNGKPGTNNTTGRGARVFSINVVETASGSDTPGGDQTDEYIAEGTVDFVKENLMSILENTKGLTCTGFGLNSGKYDHGATTQGGEATMVLNLEKKADITIQGCQYSGGTISAKSGEKAIEVTKSEDKDPVYTLTAEAGKLTLTYTHSNYIHSIAIKYVDECIAEGTVDFVNENLMSILENTKGLTCTGFGLNSGKYDHGATTQGGDATMVLNLEKKADITIQGCQYSGGTISAKSGEKAIEVTKSEDKDPVYTLTAEAGKLTLTYTHSNYIHSIDVKYVDAGDDGQTPDADGFYNGFEASKPIADRPYYYDFAATFNGAFADKTMPNEYEKGLFSFEAVGNQAVYHSEKYGVEFKHTNKLTFKVSGPCDIVVGGDNNSNCTDLAASSTSGKLKPTTRSTQTAGHANLASCKEKGDNALVYSYTGDEGAVTFTLNGDGSKAYIAYVCVIPKKAGITGKNKDGKPDVWDFAAGATEVDASGMPTKYIDTEKYNNMFSEDLMNSWFEGVAPGTGGTQTSSFKVKNDAGQVMFEFNGGGKSNNRIRTMNKKITRFDEKSLKDAEGNQYLGYVYSNTTSTDTVFLGIALEKGDIVTAVVSSNGGDSTIKFEALDDKEDVQTYEFKAGNAGIATFYATHDAEYKMYSINEKLVVGRVTVEKTDYVNVSGKVTAPESLTKDYSIVFTCKETGAKESAKVSNGAYSIDLNESYTYELSLGDANGYVITNENPSFTLDSNTIKVENDQKTFTYDVTVESVPLVTVTGKVTGFAPVAGGVENPLQNMKLTFESDKIYVPELTVAETGDFTLVLESGVEYAVTAEGVDDFLLKTDRISAAADGTQDIVFEAKPVYNVTIIPEGVTKEDLASTKLIFSRVHEKDSVKEYEEDYVYTFTGTEGIVLRDGQYEVKVEDNCPYTLLVTPDLKIEGKDVEKTLKFNADPITLWDFADKRFTDVTNFRGLLMSGVAKNKTYALGGAEGEFKVPVAGPCTVTAYYCYNATGSIEDTVEISLVKDVDDAYGSTSKEKASSYNYTGEGGYVTIRTTATTYMTKITLDYAADKTEYEAKVTVGAKGCDYTSINDALDAVRKMERTDDQRVTIEIQPGDYEEMLVIDTPNVTLKNANANPSITPVNKGVDIKASSVRITSYYGHGYAYYSMGEDCKWNADILEANKENGYMSFTNPGTGTTSGSYWNATVVIGADGFEADGIIFENSFNQYVSKKAADDVIVPLSGAKGENVAPRNSLKAGDTSVQYKDYVERAAALAIMNNYKNINFNNCSFIGRQDTLYGGVGVTAAFYDCDVYGGTDYIFGGMTAVFAKCDLVFNTNDQTDNGIKNDVGYITAPQQASGRGYLMYNCTVTSTIPGVNSASEKMSKPGQFGRPWQANTGEALFYRTIIEKTNYSGKEESLIQAVGWNSGLGGESKLSQEYASIELAGVDNSDKRVGWAQVLKAVDGKVTLADGNTVVTDDTVVAAFLGDWNPFAGKDMSIAETTPSEVVNNIPKETGLYVRFVDEWGAPASAAELDRLCAYAAGPVEPNIEVYNDGEYLIPDVDYTVRYRNNVNVGNAAVVVTGKGNYAGSTSEIPFTINKRDIADEEVYIPRDMTVVVNTKVTPVIVHNNKNLSSKSYTISGSGLTNGKYTRVTTGDNYNTLTIKGTGNYTGEVEVNVRVVDRKNAKSLKVAVDKNCKFTYGDNPDVDELVDKGLIKVTDSKSAKKLVLGENFDVVCSDTGKVGTVKFTVVGIGEYTGSVTKSFKVTPLKVTDSKKFDITYDAQAQYNDKGATVQNLTVVYTGLDEELTLGRDYKVSYKNNRKLGKAAKLTISFLGNYKGSSAITKDFEVVPAAFEYVTVIAPNKVYTKAGGSYKSVPVVKVDGATLKASNYTVSYEWKSGSQETYKKDDRVKVTLAKGDDNAEVRMTIKLKNNNYRFTEDQGVGYYDVTRAAADAEDISKAKVQFVGRNGNLLTYLNYIGMEYYSPENGAASNDRNAVYVRLMSAKTGKVIDPNLYYVEWVNATEKGTATVIINAKDGAVGSRTAKISIKAVPVSDISLSTNTTSLGGTVKLLEKYFNEL